MRHKRIRPLKTIAYTAYSLQHRMNVKRIFLPGLRKDDYYSLKSLLPSIRYSFQTWHTSRDKKESRSLLKYPYKLMDHVYKKGIKDFVKLNMDDDDEN